MRWDGAPTSSRVAIHRNNERQAFEVVSAHEAEDEGFLFDTLRESEQHLHRTTATQRTTATEQEVSPDAIIE